MPWLVQLLDNGCDGCRRLFVIDGDANQFGAGAGQSRDLLDRRGDVSRVCIRHRLHHNRCIAAHAHAIDRTSNGFPALNVSHREALF